MDQFDYDTTPENETSFAEEHPVAAEMGKNFAGAIATTAGMAVGALLVGTIKGRIEARKLAKAGAFDTPETTNE